MASNLPDYVASARPVPQASRAAWFFNTAPTYAGIMLWFVFWQDVPVGSNLSAEHGQYSEFAGGVLSQGVVWALVGLVLAALICHFLFFLVPGLLGLKTGLPLYIVGTSTYGVRGGFLMPGFLMGLLQFGWLGVNSFFAGMLLCAPWGQGVGTPAHVVVSVLWAVAAAFMGLKGIQYVARVATLLPLVPLAILVVLFAASVGGVGSFDSEAAINAGGSKLIEVVEKSEFVLQRVPAEIEPIEPIAEEGEAAFEGEEPVAGEASAVPEQGGPPPGEDEEDEEEMGDDGISLERPSNLVKVVSRGDTVTRTYKAQWVEVERSKTLQAKAPLKTPWKVIVLICTYVVGFFATAGAAGTDFGMNNRNARDVQLGGLVGIALATVFSGGLALLIVAGAHGAGKAPDGAALRATFLMEGILGSQRAADIFMWLLAIAAFPPACFSAFIASNSFKTTLPKVNPFLSVGCGTAVSILLAVTGLAGDVIGMFMIIGASFGPVCGAMAADYLLAGRKWAGPRAGFNRAGWISWVVGFIVGAADFIPPLAGRVECPPVAAFLVGFVLYYVLAKAGLESETLAMPSTGEQSEASGEPAS